MSEPFETAGRDRPFTETGPPLADIFSARPAAPRRGQGAADPDGQRRHCETATENDAVSRNDRSATDGPSAPRLRALWGTATRAQINGRTTEQRFRVGGLAGGGGRFARRRLPAPARRLIGGALLFVVIAALGLVAGRHGPPGEREPHQTPSPPQAANPARGAGAATGSLLLQPRPRRPTSARPPRPDPSPGRRDRLDAPPRPKSRPVPPSPREPIPSQLLPRRPIPSPPSPSPQAVAPPPAPAPQVPTPPARWAPALPAPVPPGSPPEFL
jgi:hypothetical protein